MLIKSACPFGQVKTKMHLSEGPFFKNSLAGASGLVLMLNPGLRPYVSMNGLKILCNISTKRYVIGQPMIAEMGAEY